MENISERPTKRLRFERQPQSEGWPTKYVLQQLWIIDDFDAMRRRREWRAVPVVDVPQPPLAEP